MYRLVLKALDTGESSIAEKACQQENVALSVLEI